MGLCCVYHPSLRSSVTRTASSSLSLGATRRRCTFTLTPTPHIPCVCLCVCVRLTNLSLSVCVCVYDFFSLPACSVSELNDFFAFHIESSTWVKVDTGRQTSGPSKRFAHKWVINIDKPPVGGWAGPHTHRHTHRHTKIGVCLCVSCA